MQAVRIDNGATLGQYLYDPFGRRVRKVTASGTLYFHYDDTGLLAEYDQSGNLISEYQYKPGSTWMTNPLFKRDGATGKVHYYYNSHLGQPLKLFDKSGKVTWAARSQAFGGASVVVNEVENNLRFPGQYEDGESGLFYNRYRYYAPEIGVYLREDPEGIYAGLNYYVYADGNSISFIDPYGLTAGVAVLGGVGSGGTGAAMAAFGTVGAAIAAGAAVGVTAGMLLNAGFESIAGESIGLWVYAVAHGELTERQRQQKDLEHKRYHQQCDKKPPGGLDPCQEAKWKYDNAKKCYDLRSAWEKRWGSEATRSRHAGQLAEVKRRMANAAEDIKKNCNKECS
jgi:RHS repeat-associated protein